MHWLLSLDIGVFHFINGSLTNPVFDWLMPLLSGGGSVMHWFVLTIVLAAIAAVVFGDLRARLCALMIVLVVIIGDPLIVNTIKHAVARPRPCRTLPDVNERLGCTGSGSMPSAHSANWFAATMVIFLFYRKKRWLMFSMLGMAVAVSFSRVYNGVHYPSDVLAGAILGAGYAVAIAVAAQTAWDFAGKRWFPAWHHRVPNLLGVEGRGSSEVTPEKSSPPPSTVPKSEIEFLNLGYLLILLMLIGRWIYLASGTIELEKDEAYQWLWSKHLAWSYYSKPFGIALIQFVGTHLFGDTAFGVRFFSPLFAALLSFISLRFLAREIGPKLALILLLIVTATPLLGVGTILMTIDPPLVLCWTWALIAGWRAIQSPGKIRDWLVVGLAMGLGFLCKYTAAAQLVCWVLVFLLSADARAHLRRPGPWLALLVFLACTTPVLIWNAEHGWITVHHVAGDAGMESHWKPTLRYFWDFIFTQGGLLNPVFFLGAVWAMFAFWKQRRPLWVYFFCMSAPLYLGYWLFTFHSGVLPNWPVAAVPGLFCLMVVYWNDRLRRGARWVKPVLVAGLAIGFLALPFMYETKLIGKVAGQLLPTEVDPLRRVRAWKQTAEVVEAAREKLQAEGKPAFIVGAHYSTTSLLAFYLPQARAVVNTRPLVYCIDSDQPVNQLYFWPEYRYLDNRKGENAIFVSEVDTDPLEKGWLWKWLRHEPVKRAGDPEMTPTGQRQLAFIHHRLQNEFASVQDLGDRKVQLNGRVYRRIHLWACYDAK